MFRLNGRHRLWNRQTAMPIAAAAGAGLVFDGPGAALAAALLAVPFGLIAGRGLPGVWKTTGEDAASGPADPYEAGRRNIIAALDHALASEHAPRRGPLCLCLALEDAEDLRDTFGEEARLSVLDGLLDRLQSELRAGDRVVVIGPARFGVMPLPGKRMDLETAVQIAGRLRTMLSEPMSIDATTILPTIAVGFCLPSQVAERSGTALLTAATRALEAAIRGAPGAIRGYAPDIALAAVRHEGLRGEAEMALESGQILAYFQPQISTDTGALSGFEALVRWQHPVHGILAPGEFLPAILEAGLGARLSEVMLSAALGALRRWDQDELAVPRVAVNFSHQELSDPFIAAKVRWDLDRFELAPERLAVEILESVVTRGEDDLVTRNIAALAALGCAIDLDDFGTGNASIAAIRRFAVDRIKIDRSFVTRVDRDAEQQKMIAAILSMAERLGIDTLAEGVETTGEHALLAQLGCGHVQGYGIARPMPFEATGEWLALHRRKIAHAPGIARRTG
ncbi:MAG: GGDEF domain-containing protein [Defluviimonas sp.]|uniref:EAL domain-containing protein n=1 Tax=Albidovulum sp. TaxID=1872424 RepID=UPI001DDB5A58|nr:GGDEF domain-containing protein [Paracoccaceae bacterium]MCC0064672.1 GGDEF domain-containing protein [Defluviimonas sp.]